MWEQLAAYAIKRRAARQARRGGAVENASPAAVEGEAQIAAPRSRLQALDSPIVTNAQRVGDRLRAAVTPIAMAPRGQIAILLFVILFIVFAIVPAGSAGQSRLQLVFAALTGRAQVASVPAAAATTTAASSAAVDYSALMRNPLPGDFAGGPRV